MCFCDSFWSVSFRLTGTERLREGNGASGEGARDEMEARSFVWWWRWHNVQHRARRCRKQESLVRRPTGFYRPSRATIVVCGRAWGSSTSPPSNSLASELRRKRGATLFPAFLRAVRANAAYDVYARQYRSTDVRKRVLITTLSIIKATF